MLSNKFFNSFISDTFWRHSNLSKLRAGFADLSKSFTSGLSRRFFLSAEEEIDSAGFEETGQFRLHLRGIFAYNSAAFHAAKWETASVGGFVHLADLFFSKQQHYWAGGGNYGYRAGGSSPLFFQSLSNFSSVISFERILFSSETRFALGRFLFRFNQTAPFYLNGLGRKNTSLINYRARPQSQFLRELEPITKTSAKLFDTFLQPTPALTNFQNYSSLAPHLYGFASVTGPQRMVVSRLGYLNDFTGFLDLSDQYRQRHLARPYVGLKFSNGAGAINSWTASLVGGCAGELYAAYGFFNVTYRVPLKIFNNKETSLLVGCGFTYLDQDFSAFAVAFRATRNTSALRLSRVLALSYKRMRLRALSQLELQLLTATGECNRFKEFFPTHVNRLMRNFERMASLRYRVGLKTKVALRVRSCLAHLSKWEVAAASKYKAAFAFRRRVKSMKSYGRISSLPVRLKLSIGAEALKSWGVEKFISVGSGTGAALSFPQALLTAITSALPPQLPQFRSISSVAAVRRSYYRFWFNKRVSGGDGVPSSHHFNLLFTIFDFTGTLRRSTLGIVGQLFKKSFYARRYLKLFPLYNELVLIQTCVPVSKNWLYRLAKLNESSSVRCVRRGAARFAPLKYVELLSVPSNAFTRTHAPAALTETSEVGLMGFARGGVSKHHAEFFLLFSSAQFGWGSTLTNHRLLNPVNRFTAGRSRRQSAQLNFDMEFFDRIAGVMWSTNVAFPAKGQASLASSAVMSRFNVTLGVASFVPEYRRSWFFNSLDSVQSLGLTRAIFGGGVTTAASDFNCELVVGLPWSAIFSELTAAAALRRRSTQVVNPSGARVSPLTATLFWNRINLLSLYDL